MDSLHSLLLYIQHSVSFCGVLVILMGVLAALYHYIFFLFHKSDTPDINEIRLRLGRVLTLGLEFIVAADLIGTTTAPDYYSVGQGSRYLVKDFSPPWLKSTRQRAKLKGRDRPASGTLP